MDGRAVILEHRRPAERGAHADLMIDPPAGLAGGAGLDDFTAHDGGAGLWTLRLRLIDGRPGAWVDGMAFVAVELAPHRRRYLTAQGPLDAGPAGKAAGRGSVRRIDEGARTVEAWSASRRVVRVGWRAAGAWRVAIDRLPGGGGAGDVRWRGVVTPIVEAADRR